VASIRVTKGCSENNGQAFFISGIISAVQRKFGRLWRGVCRCTWDTRTKATINHKEPALKPETFWAEALYMGEQARKPWSRPTYLWRRKILAYYLQAIHWGIRLDWRNDGPKDMTFLCHSPHYIFKKSTDCGCLRLVLPKTRAGPSWINHLPIR